MKSLAKNITFTAVFSALCCVSTTLITLPLPYGYFNVGDVFVLLSGWFLGPLYGAVAAAVGSAFADVFCSFALYAPATFFIKGADAAVAALLAAVVKKLVKKRSLDFLARTAGAVAGESVMLLGYFLFESALYQSFIVGAAALAGNALQGLCCGAIAVAVFAALYPIKTVRRFFPHLSDE